MNLAFSDVVGVFAGCEEMMATLQCCDAFSMSFCACEVELGVAVEEGHWGQSTLQLIERIEQEINNV